MITIVVPHRTSGGVVPMIGWVNRQGLIFRRDWSWDRSNDSTAYVFKFNKEFEQTAITFALKFA
jgi:hypothetical protein